MEAAVRQAISVIWAKYCEPIKFSELASSLFVSPFHFLRVFAKTTGVTPGRYLSAVRMFEAKRLLLTTSLTVSDVVCGVGYSSVGTFTSRFTHIVGMTPSQYREPEVGKLLVAVGRGFSRVPSLDALRGADFHHVPGGGSIVGTIELPPEAAPGNIFVGVFGAAVPQSAPVAHTYLNNVGSSKLAIHGVPPGRWTVIAVAQSRTGPVLVDSQLAPVTATPGGATRVRLRLRWAGPTNPPLAISLAGNAQPAAARPRRVMAAVA